MTPREDDDWIFDPSLAGISRRLNQQFRQEAQAVESETRDYEQRLRTFAELVLEARNRGDVARIDTRGRSFTGTVSYAASDFLSLRGEEYEVDILRDAIASFRVVERGRRGGDPLPEGPGNFEMRLLERRGISQVEIGQALLGEVLGGRITAVGQDHLILEDANQEEVILPLANVTWVVQRRRVR